MSTMSKTRPCLTAADVADRATLSITEVAALLGVSRGAAYEAVRRGDIPVIHFGRRLVVPTAALLRLLGREPK